jgi:hypothetical protein
MIWPVWGDFGHFMPKNKELPSLVGILDVSGQNNKDLSGLGDFGRFRPEE